MWKTKTHIKKYQDPWITTWQDEVYFPNGGKTLYGYIEFGNGAHAVVLDKNRKIILFKQYRYPIGKMCWSIPGGGIEKDETPEMAVKREVEEEIGVKVRALKKLGKEWHLCGTFCREEYHLFIGYTSDNPKIRGEKNELVAKIKSFSGKEVLRMIDQGEIAQTYVSNALQMAIRKLNLG